MSHKVAYGSTESFPRIDCFVVRFVGVLQFSRVVSTTNWTGHFGLSADIPTRCLKAR